MTWNGKMIKKWPKIAKMAKIVKIAKNSKVLPWEAGMSISAVPIFGSSWSQALWS